MDDADVVEPLEVLEAGPPGGGPPRWWVVPVVLALVVGWFMLPDRDVPVPDPAASVAASASAPDPSSARPSGYQPGYRGTTPVLASVCIPRTDGLHSLRISFALINRGTEPVRIIDVQPWLGPSDSGGLEARRTRVVPGDCGSSLDTPLRTPLAPGGTALVVLDLALPDTCPQPYSVGAVVTSAVSGRPRSTEQTQIPVYPDLGSMRFTTCVGLTY